MTHTFYFNVQEKLGAMFYNLCNSIMSEHISDLYSSVKYTFHPQHWLFLLQKGIAKQRLVAHARAEANSYFH